MITNKLQTILENPKYMKNAKLVSAMFRDQKEKPLDRAIWWIEWLIRNSNADHMKSPVNRLGFIVGNSYDVIAIVSLMFGLILYLGFKLIMFVQQFFRVSNANVNVKQRKSE